MDNKLETMLEALLFAYGDPISKKRLAKLTGERQERILDAIEGLDKRLKETSGLRLMRNSDEVQLVSAKEFGPQIERIFSSRRKEELSRASLEVLAIIGYSGPISRDSIEEIRGVNSAFIVRTLLMRGLIEPTGRKGKEQFVLTIEALKRLGVTSAQDLPDWIKVQDDIEKARQSIPNSHNA